jgi:hypothetical protein
MYLYVSRCSTDTLYQVCRRFDKTGAPRAVLLTTEEGKFLRAQLKKELMLYLNNQAPFHDGLYAGLDVAPADWWRQNAPNMDEDGNLMLIRMAAVKIVSLAPESTENEKLHQIFKLTRTKTRNRLGYTRALGLNFINWEDRNSTDAVCVIDFVCVYLFVSFCGFLFISALYSTCRAIFSQTNALVYRLPKSLTGLR